MQLDDALASAAITGPIDAPGSMLMQPTYAPLPGWAPNAQLYFRTLWTMWKQSPPIYRRKLLLLHGHFGQYRFGPSPCSIPLGDIALQSGHNRGFLANHSVIIM
jgi:hypothetical protein